jgi:hypothetical protein
MSPPHSKVMRLRAPLASALVIIALRREEGEEKKDKDVKVRMLDGVEDRSSVRTGMIDLGSLGSTPRTGFGYEGRIPSSD